jgi:hypothetical protein
MQGNKHWHLWFTASGLAALFCLVELYSGLTAGVLYGGEEVGYLRRDEDSYGFAWNLIIYGLGAAFYSTAFLLLAFDWYSSRRGRRRRDVA